VAALTDPPLRWAVVLVDLDPSRGHEQAGRRRALVVSYEAFHRSGMATVCPITTRRPKYPGEVPLP
jgi:mRNA interferase MazF